MLQIYCSDINNSLDWGVIALIIGRGGGDSKGTQWLDGVHTRLRKMRMETTHLHWWANTSVG